MRRFYGVMVSTLDFESNDPSSSLGRSSIFFFLSFKPIRKDAVQLKNRNDKYQSGSIMLNPKFCIIETD